MKLLKTASIINSLNDVDGFLLVKKNSEFKSKIYKESLAIYIKEKIHNYYSSDVWQFNMLKTIEHGINTMYDEDEVLLIFFTENELGMKWKAV